SAIAMRVLHVGVGEPRARVFVPAGMWMPASARFVATRTADRQWKSPFPLRRWGRPKWIVIVLPLATVTAIYLSAYAFASLGGVPRSPAAWAPRRVAVNVSSHDGRQL